MFVHMNLVRRETLQAHGKTFELLLFKVEETGDLRLFVASGGFGVGPTFAADSEVVADLMTQKGEDAAEMLLQQAKSDIESNANQWY